MPPISQIAARRFLAGALALALAACTTATPRPDFPLPGFAGYGPIHLDIAEVRVSSNYRPRGAPPNVDHLFQIDIESSAIRWAHERLVASGVDGEAAFVIEDASVIETALDTDEGLVGLFKNENAVRYDATLTVRLTLLRDGNVDAVDVTVTRSQTMLENTSLNDRDTIWYEMMDRMLVELNTQMEENIAAHLGRYLHRRP